MKYINVEKCIMPYNLSMSDLHSHNHYEIYFLVKGERSFFLSNKMYNLKGPVIIIIPPYVMHKTEGGPYERYNTYVTDTYLNAFESSTLNNKSLEILIPTKEEKEYLIDVLEKITNLGDTIHKNELINTLFSYYIYLLEKVKKENYNPFTTPENKKHSLVTLKVIAYLNEHYKEKITLDEIANKFFVSKSTLNYNFKNTIGGTPMDYLLNLRITSAKKMLLETKKSIHQISDECGFSSPNYFCLIFKKRESVSPATYRKMYE